MFCVVLGLSNICLESGAGVIFGESIYLRFSFFLVDSSTSLPNRSNAKISRLRVIDKYEADYNLVLTLYWPKITNQIAEKTCTLGKNQMVNRKKSAADSALINEFIIDTARINQ